MDKSIQEVADELLDAFTQMSCAPQQGQWRVAHRGQLSIELLEHLKERSDSQLLADPKSADQITRCVLLLAEQMAEQPLAQALASWARGNWAYFHAPNQAIELYVEALDVYRSIEDPVITVRLLSNLIAASVSCGRFAEAQSAYSQSQSLLDLLTENDQGYLAALQQNYGTLLHYMGQYDEAIVVHQQTADLARRLEQPERLAEVQVNHAFTLAALGNLRKGEVMLLESRQVAVAQHHALTVARIDLNLGMLYTARGLPAQALQHHQSARSQFEALDNQMEVASVLLYEAELFERLGALREARQRYAKAQQVFGELGMQTEVGTALVKAAVVNRQYGEYTQATKQLEDAQALWTLLDQPVWSATVQLEYAALYLAQQNLEKAITQLGQIAEPRPSPALELRWLSLWASAHAQGWYTTGVLESQSEARRGYQRLLNAATEQGEYYLHRQALVGLGKLTLPDDMSQAVDLLEQAVELDRRFRQSLSVEELKASFQRQTEDILPLLASTAIESGHPEQALNYMWRSKGGALLELATQRVIETKSASDILLDDVRQQLAGQRWQLLHNEAMSLPESVIERNNSEIRKLEEQLYELRRQRNREAAYREPALSASLEQLLDENEIDVLIEYVNHENQILAVRADRSGKRQALNLVDVDTILDLLDELQLAFQNVLMLPIHKRATHGKNLDSECQLLLQECYELLIAPLGELPHNSRLLLAPCEPLYLLPFAAFWDGQAFLAECCEIEVTPTAALLMAPQLEHQSGPALLIGASAEGQLEAIKMELAAVEATLEESVALLDDPDSFRYLNQLKSAPNLLHIATHTIQRADSPLMTALQLPGHLLSVEQCYDLALHGTELVTLSGCATASGLDTSGALLAFQSAFLVAGARHVLSTLWPIDDQATAQWMAYFYGFLKDGVRPSLALRQTQQKLLLNCHYHHPAFWAAFTCSRR